MKTKTNIEGNKYLFYENDYELEAVALRLISLLPKHSGAVGKPLKEQLWDCAFDLIETTPSNSTIFKRCQSITNETEGDRVFQLLSDVITNVVKVAKMENEKVVKIDFDINNTTVAQVTSTSILNISAGHSLQLPAYTVVQANGLGNVATGQVIYVSNGAAGSPCLAVYSGGAWKQVAIGSTITT